MRRRSLYLVALAIAPALAGCGGIVAASTEPVHGRDLTIYSSLPLDGPEAPISAQIVNGEKLALAQAHGQVGRLHISYSSLNDANPKTGHWEPGIVATNAKLAAQDNDAIAYLGDYDSEATAVSLSITNGANILQVSPGSPYVGLTSSMDAGQDEPGRFYPSGKITFGRLLPGDIVEAAAQVSLMRRLGIHTLYTLSDEDPFDVSLVGLVTGDAEQAGIHVTGGERLRVESAAEFNSTTEKVAASGAQAVFFGGAPEPGTVSLWHALHQSQAQLWLLGSDALGTGAFAAQLGSAAARTLIASPWLSPTVYPAAASAVLRLYESTFHETAHPYALAGYEAMAVVLDAIRAAGRHGNERQAVIDKFFATRHHASVLGTYSVQPSGATTLSRYGVDRVVGGRLAFDTSFQVPPEPAGSEITAVHSG